MKNGRYIFCRELQFWYQPPANATAPSCVSFLLLHSISSPFAYISSLLLLIALDAKEQHEGRTKGTAITTQPGLRNTALRRRRCRKSNDSALFAPVIFEIEQPSVLMPIPISMPHSLGNRGDVASTELRTYNQNIALTSHEVHRYGYLNAPNCLRIILVCIRLCMYVRRTWNGTHTQPQMQSLDVLFAIGGNTLINDEKMPKKR